MSAVRGETWLWLAQRASAGILAVCVIVHLAGMIIAVQGGLSADEILARTRGSWLAAAFYGSFVLAVSVHAPIGLRAVLVEWSGMQGRAADLAAALLALVLLGLGWSAVRGVVS